MGPSQVETFDEDTLCQEFKVLSQDKKIEEAEPGLSGEKEAEGSKGVSRKRKFLKNDKTSSKAEAKIRKMKKPKGIEAVDNESHKGLKMQEKMEVKSEMVLMDNDRGILSASVEKSFASTSENYKVSLWLQQQPHELDDIKDDLYERNNDADPEPLRLVGPLTLTNNSFNSEVKGLLLDIAGSAERRGRPLPASFSGIKIHSDGSSTSKIKTKKLPTEDPDTITWEFTKQLMSEEKAVVTLKK